MKLAGERIQEKHFQCKNPNNEIKPKTRSIRKSGHRYSSREYASLGDKEYEKRFAMRCWRVVQVQQAVEQQVRWLAL